MADIQPMAQVINQAAIVATKEVMQTMTATRIKADTRQRSKAVSKGTKLGVPPLKQPSLNWSDKTCMQS